MATFVEVHPDNPQPRTVAQVEVDREPSREERVSDHAAVVADYAFPPAS